MPLWLFERRPSAWLPPDPLQSGQEPFPLAFFRIDLARSVNKRKDSISARTI